MISRDFQITLPLELSPFANFIPLPTAALHDPPADWLARIARFVASPP
jgi:hypothetical protein